MVESVTSFYVLSGPAEDRILSTGWSMACLYGREEWEVCDMKLCCDTKLFCRQTMTLPKPANGAGIHGLNMSEFTMVTRIVCPEATVL